MPKKYENFVESAPRTKPSKYGTGSCRSYVGISCPICKVEFVELPSEHVQTSKASRCKQHLDKCHAAPRDASADAKDLLAENQRLRAELDAERSNAGLKETRLIERNNSQGQRLRSVEQQLDEIKARLAGQDQWQEQVSKALGLDAPPIPTVKSCIGRIEALTSGRKRLRDQLSDKEAELQEFQYANRHADKIIRCMMVMTKHPGAAKVFLRKISLHSHPDRNGQSESSKAVSTGFQTSVNYLAETL